MIEELNKFFKACIDRYGRADFISEVVITDDAAKMIPQVGPKPGESIDIHCAMGIVTIKNNGKTSEKKGEDDF